MLTKIEKLPSSKKREFKVKDWLKALGLLILLCLSDTLPEIKEIVTGHDFGSYNGVIQAVFVIGVWMIQRWAKDTRK